MSDATTQQDWKAGLTEAQVGTVEKAARAVFDVGRYSAKWDEMSDVYRANRCSEMLAALRAAKHPDFPEPPKPTRGEVVAEKLVSVYRRGDVNVLWFHDAVNGGGQVTEGANEEYLDCIREWIAAAIDAERAAAFGDGINEAAAWLAGELGESNRLVEKVRELAKGAQPK